MPETIPSEGGLITRRNLFLVAAGVLAAGVLTKVGIGSGGEATSTTDNEKGEPANSGGRGGGAEVVDTRKRFHEIIGGLVTGNYPELTQSIHAAIGLSPATSFDTNRLILPQGGSSLMAARFNNVDYSRTNPGRELSLSVVPEKKNAAGKISDLILRSHQAAGVQPQAHPDLPGHLLFYNPNAQPGYSNPGRLTVLRETEPDYIVDMTLTEFGHNSSQHTEVVGGYELAVGVAREFQRALG